MVLVYEEPSTCVIGEQCSTGCCLNRVCVEYSECFQIYALPLILGVIGGAAVFLVIFVTIYVRGELKKKRKNLFKREKMEEDKLLRSEFPIKEKFILTHHAKSTEGGLLNQTI